MIDTSVESPCAVMLVTYNCDLQHLIVAPLYMAPMLED